MKWKEFKKKIEEQGVNDETEILYIDTDMYNVTVTHEDGTVRIWS